MNRRSGQWIIRILFAAALSLGVLVPQAVAATPLPAALPTTEPASLPTTTDPVIDEANPFLPENRNLTDCIGMLQRPGCGSEARGGWHQNLVAIAMVGGLLLVFGRVAWGIRKSQRTYSD